MTDAMAAARAARRPRIPKPPRERKTTGVPPPLTFDFDALHDSALLTGEEVASRLRRSTATIAFWRWRQNHPLKWKWIQGRAMYRVGDVRAYEKIIGEPRKNEKRGMGRHGKREQT